MKLLHVCKIKSTHSECIINNKVDNNIMKKEIMILPIYVGIKRKRNFKETFNENTI